MRRRTSTGLVAALVATLLQGCRSADPDPTVLVRTVNGVELGVSTDHGVVFLGRTATSGDAELVTWFGDGPSIEPGLIEDMGGDLYTLDVAVRIPTVEIDFDPKAPGTELTIRGRGFDGVWERTTTVADGVPASGLVLEPPVEPLPSECSGAGVFARDRDGDLRLVGMLVGRALVETPSGTRDVVCAISGMDLWRVVTYDRNRHRKPNTPARP